MYDKMVYKFGYNIQMDQYVTERTKIYFVSQPERGFL